MTVAGDIYGNGAVAVDPNNGVNARGPIFWDRTHMMKLSGSYLFGWGILASANLLVQSGPVFTRTVTTPAPPPDPSIPPAPGTRNQGPVTVFAEPRDQSDRLDTLSMVELEARSGSTSTAIGLWRLWWRSTTFSTPTLY